MPYSTRILEVTCKPILLTEISTLVTQPKATLSLLAVSILLASDPAKAQPAMLTMASDIDWVSWEDLNESQRDLLKDNCCGQYIEPESDTASGDTGATDLSSDTLISHDNGDIEVTGNVKVQKDDSLISANRGIYNTNTRHFTLSENIRIRQSGLLITGNSAEVDESSGSSTIAQASYLLHESGIRGSAEIIVYTDADGVITIDNGIFTRCEPGNNSWLIVGEEIILDQNSGRGKARNVTLQINDVPVLYLPWVSFPINDTRSSGFLAPVIGSTRDGGTDIATPYYLNLAPNYDATLTPRVQFERGVMLGLETRYRGKRSQHILDTNYLPGDKLYDPATAGIANSDSPPREDRWLLNYDYQGILAPDWSASVDYAAVSDTDYFQDLGNNGLGGTSRSFLYRDARLKYRSQNWDFTAATQAFQIIDPAVSPLSEPYKQLPRLNLQGSFTQPWGLEYGIDADFVMFDRSLNANQLTQGQIDNGILVTGSRLSLIPEISFPWSNSYAFATPTLKYKYASWNLDDNALNTDANPSRSVASASFDSGLIFERNVNLFGNDLTQTLEPRAYYLYNGYENQSDIPLFDSSSMTFSFGQLFREDRFSGKDRVGDTSQLTLAVSSRLYGSKGEELARASIGQIQYFRDRRVTLFNAPGVLDKQSSSAIAGEFSLQLSDDWRANSYLEWNTSANEMDVGNFQFQYQSDINHILNLGYRYRDVAGPATVNGIKRRIDQSDISGIWPLNDKWGLIGRWNYDLANSRNLEAIAGVEYNNCCWSVRVLARQWIDNNALFYGIEDNNSGIFIQFELKGLGSVLGGNVTGILNNGISGYRERDYVQ